MAESEKEPWEIINITRAQLIIHDETKSVGNPEDRIFTFQFNPQSLNISGSNHSQESSKKLDINTNQQTDIAEENKDKARKFTLSFKTMFDGVTARDRVELLIYALHGQTTRSVTFQWGTLFYTCILSSADAEYTMFDSNGTPIRASIDISIELNNKNVKEDLHKDFQEVFENETPSLAT